MPNINWLTTGAMNRPVTCGLPVAKVLSIGFGTTAFGKGLPYKGIDELLHVAIDEHDVAALLQRQRGFGLALELGQVALAQRRRGGQCLQSLDLAYDLTVNSGRQNTGLAHQFVSNLTVLRVG